MINRKLLEIIAENGELNACDFLKHVPIKRGDYLDYYPVAALLHAGFITTDSTTESGGEKKMGVLGINTKDSAVFLQQLMLPEGESFEIDGCPRDSAKDFPVKFFITAEGYIKLEEMQENDRSKKQKRTDYFMSFSVAILAAVLSSVLFHYFAIQRTHTESTKTNTTSENEVSASSKSLKERDRASSAAP